MSGLLLLCSALGLAVALGLLKAVEARRLQDELTTYELRFPPKLPTEAVVAFLDGLTGLLLPWWRRWLITPSVVLELHASSRGVVHRVLVPEAWSPLLENLLQAHLPGVRYTPLPPAAASQVAVGAEYRLSSSRRALRSDAMALSARLLSSLQPLRAHEAVVVQWLLTPSGPVAPANAERVAAPSVTSLLHGRRRLDPEAVTALRQKQSQPLLLGVARIGVQASGARQRSLLRRVEAAWHSSRAPGVEMRRRAFGEARVAQRLRSRALPLLLWPGLFNTEELAGLVGWPIEAEQIPGLVLSSARQLAPSPLLPTRGTVIGEATFPGSQRPVALELEGRLRHLHVVGPTGTGKSTLLLNLIEQDLRAGYGVIVVDPKGDLVSEVLERVPRARQHDVIVLDPADEQVAVGLNPLRAANGKRADVAVENLVGLLKSLYKSSWGPRTDDILRATAATLAATGDATLCEIPTLLTDATYRRRIVGQLDDPIGLESFWGWYEGLSEAERFSVVGPVLNKVRAFTMRRRVRGIVGQVSPPLVLDDVLRDRRVLLVSLASGLLGEEAASLLGALIFSDLWHATTARTAVAPTARPAAMAHLDEWQHFLALPTPMPAMLAEARGLGLGLTLAHQHLAQLPNDVRDAVLANARSRVAFQLPAADAAVLAKQFGSGLGADDLKSLGGFEVMAQLYADGRTQPAVSLRTLPASAPSSDATALRERSAKRYGVARAEVEQAIRQRQQASAPSAPVGRRRRR